MKSARYGWSYHDALCNRRAEKTIPSANGKRSRNLVSAFSEPGAGSDLAGIKTKAELDGDTWTINGQKVWTSGAHYSDYAILVTRSDFNAPKHKGLTTSF